MNVLYVVPNLSKVSGGPRTRIAMFKNVFIKDNGLVIENGNKFFKSIVPRKINKVYVESATNRINLIDIISLFFLRFYSKEMTVFIRDIYIELFPEEYQTLRSKITLVLNKLSNYYLTLISTSMVFPTHNMGQVFFDKNKIFPKRKFSELPPGALLKEDDRVLPDFNEKLGILYLGSTKYTNSGFDNFIKFSKSYSDTYNFFVLSGDKDLNQNLAHLPIHLESVNHNEIANFITLNNIAFAMHTRPINEYDELTFPIKILDFVSLQLPFFSEKHSPLVGLLGSDYRLFLSINDFENIHKIINNLSQPEYSSLLGFLKEITKKNTYNERYKKLLTV